jgi:hypothetical protein
VAVETTQPPSDLLDPAICDRNNTEDCVVMALVFEEPVTLSGALFVTNDWLALAVFRAEAMCVAASSFEANPAERIEELGHSVPGEFRSDPGDLTCVS